MKMEAEMFKLNFKANPREMILSNGETWLFHGFRSFLKMLADVIKEGVEKKVRGV